MNTVPPADKVQQVVSVDAQGLISQSADVFALQIAIDPADFATSDLFDDTNRALCAVGGLLVDDAELYG